MAVYNSVHPQCMQRLLGRKPTTGLLDSCPSMKTGQGKWANRNLFVSVKCFKGRKLCPGEFAGVFAQVKMMPIFKHMVPIKRGVAANM